MFSSCMQHNCKLYQTVVKFSERAKQLVIFLLSWLLQMCRLSSGARREQCSSRILIRFSAPLTMPVLQLWLKADPIFHLGSLAIIYSNYLFYRILSHFRRTVTFFFTGRNTYDGILQPVTYCHTLSNIFSLKSSVYSTVVVFLIFLPQNSDFFLCLEVKWQLQNSVVLVQEGTYTAV